MKKRTFEIAIKKAWELLQAIGKTGEVEIDFLGNRHRVDFERKTIVNLTEDVPVKEYYQVLILHYLAREKAVVVPEKTDWVGFRNLESGKFYYSAFAQRSLARLNQGFSQNPGALWGRAQKLTREKLTLGDFSFRIQVFPKISVAVIYWGGDEEVSPQFDLLFNREISRIYSTEDVVVLAQSLVGVLSRPIN